MKDAPNSKPSPNEILDFETYLENVLYIFVDNTNVMSFLYY
jgi:hypothetical protein